MRVLPFCPGESLGLPALTLASAQHPVSGDSSWVSTVTLVPRTYLTGALGPGLGRAKRSLSSRLLPSCVSSSCPRWPHLFRRGSRRQTQAFTDSTTLDPPSNSTTRGFFKSFSILWLESLMLREVK